MGVYVHVPDVVYRGAVRPVLVSPFLSSITKVPGYLRACCRLGPCGCSGGVCLVATFFPLLYCASVEGLVHRSHSTSWVLLFCLFCLSRQAVCPMATDPCQRVLHALLVSCTRSAAVCAVVCISALSNGLRKQTPVATYLSMFCVLRAGAGELRSRFSTEGPNRNVVCLSKRAFLCRSGAPVFLCFLVGVTPFSVWRISLLL